VTAKQKLFVKHYLIDLNATKAAISAGYSEKTADVQGSRLLRNAKIRAKIDEGTTKRAAKLDISAEKVLSELALLAFANMDDYVDVLGGKRVLNTAKPTRDQMAAVQEITEDTTGGTGDGERKMVLRTKFKLSDKGINLERLGRHLKLFTDRVEHTGLEGLADRLNLIRKRKHADT
jgi:phage terminase small subunit